MEDVQQEEVSTLTSAPEKPAPAKEPAPHSAVAIVDDWFRGISQNTVMGRDTEIYNHVHRSLVDLKERLAKELPQ